MLNIEKIKIGQRVWCKHFDVAEYGTVQAVTPSGRIRVLYPNGKSILHSADQLMRTRPNGIRKSKKEKEQEDSSMLDVLEKLPEKLRDDVWKAIVCTNLTIREVLEIKELLPKEK